MPPAANSTQALQNVQGFQGSMQSPDQIVQGTEQSLGVPQASQAVSGLRQAITNTTNLLNNVAPSVYGRTQNSLVTSAQAGRQIQNEEAPISKTLADQTSKESQASSDLSTLLGRAGTLESLKASGQSEKLANLQQIYQDLYGQEKDKAAADAAAATAAENIREFNVSQATSRSNASTAAGAKTPTAANQLQSSVQSMSSELSSIAGSDGYVSPQNYTKGMQAWTSAGLSPKLYDTYMAVYRDPKNGAYLLSTGKYSG